MKETDAHLEKFKHFEHEPKQPSWVFPLRKAGIARFGELGFPTVEQRDWRFTNVAPIAKLPFKPVFQVSRNGLTPEAIGQFTFGRLAATRLVFVNGQYVAELSSLAPKKEGVTITNLAAALASDSGLIEKHLGRYARGEDNAFTSLNTAFFQDGAFVHLSAGKMPAEPIHLVFVSNSKEAGATSHPRNLLIAEKGSQATILETYVSTVDAPYFTNAVTE